MLTASIAEYVWGLDLQMNRQRLREDSAGMGRYFLAWTVGAVPGFSISRPREYYTQKTAGS